MIKKECKYGLKYRNCKFREHALLDMLYMYLNRKKYKLKCVKLLLILEIKFEVCETPLSYSMVQSP